MRWYFIVSGFLCEATRPISHLHIFVWRKVDTFRSSLTFEFNVKRRLPLAREEVRNNFEASGMK